MLYIRTKESSSQPWVAIGFPFHASITPHIRDIYLEPVYFHGPEDGLDKDKLSSIQSMDANSHMDWGLLIHMDDVVFIRVLHQNPKKEATNGG